MHNKWRLLSHFSYPFKADYLRIGVGLVKYLAKAVSCKVFCHFICGIYSAVDLVYVKSSIQHLAYGQRQLRIGNIEPAALLQKPCTLF